MNKCLKNWYLKNKNSAHITPRTAVYRVFSGDATEKCVVVTPTIRSVMASSPGRAETPSSPDGQGPAPSPRAGNRTLISWGFNSTTFSAEPLTQSSQWSVAVEKNTSKIGNINSGYLFGVGIAQETLSSKDQVSRWGFIFHGNPHTKKRSMNEMNEKYIWCMKNLHTKNCVFMAHSA